MSAGATTAAALPRSGTRSPTASDAALGQKIRELRRLRGLTQSELAALAGVTGAQVHRYEAGGTRIAASRLVAIARALGAQPDSLIGFCTTKAEPAPIAADADLMPGLALRDWFAGQALCGLTARVTLPALPSERALIAERAYGFADAMLAARATGGEA